MAFLALRRWVSGACLSAGVCFLPQAHAQSTNCLPTPADLVAWWPGEFTATDLRGSHHGTLESGTTFGAGKVGAAFSFDGVDDFVASISSSLTGVSNNFTIEFWAWPNRSRNATTESTSGIVGTSAQRYAIAPEYGGTSGPAGVGVSVGTNGISVFEHADSYLPSPLVYAATLTNWTHVAVVYESKTPKLYINGSLVRTGLTSPRVLVFPSKTFGNITTYGPYGGLLDEVSIYNRALSATEVQAVFDADAYGKCQTNYSLGIRRA